MHEILEINFLKEGFFLLSPTEKYEQQRRLRRLFVTLLSKEGRLKERLLGYKENTEAGCLMGKTAFLI
jgi:hypothetical protein